MNYFFIIDESSRSMFIDVLYPVAEGRGKGLFSRCRRSKQELFRELELPESLCNCPFSDSNLDRKLALRLPG